MHSRFYGKYRYTALDVIEQHSDLYEVYCLTANNRVQELAEQARKFHPAAVVIANEARYEELKDMLSDELISRFMPVLRRFAISYRLSLSIWCWLPW
mgnify:CR=1 FL=1